MSAIKTSIPTLVFSAIRDAAKAHPEINIIKNKNIRIHMYHPWSSMTDGGLNDHTHVMIFTPKSKQPCLELIGVVYFSVFRELCCPQLGCNYSRTPPIRPPSESHWCGRIRGMVAREGFVYEQKPLSVTRNVVVWEGWSTGRWWGWSFVRGSTV